MKICLKISKIKKVLIYPMAFIIDNPETDFELDIEYRHVKRARNKRL